MKRAIAVCALAFALVSCNDYIPRDEHPERTRSPQPIMTVLPCGMRGLCVGG